jgi:hypothetical protein
MDRGHRLAVAGAIGEHLRPGPIGLGVVAALGGECRQVAERQVAVDPLVLSAAISGVGPR